MNQQINILDLVALLELPESILGFLNQDYQAAVQGAEKFKKTVKKQRRLLAKKYHPDVADGNSELMKKINDATDLLSRLRVLPPQPRFIVIRVDVHGYAGTTNTATSGF